ALWVGYNAGYNLTLRVAMPLLTNISRTMLPWTVHRPDGSFDLATSINNFLFTAITLMTLCYFLFSMTAFRGRAEVLYRFTRMVMMIAFGAGFGTGIANYVSLLIGRLDFIFSDMFGVF
ncbi:MAG: hypothetical protein FWF06_07255, partial [Symbiobacteriaceae bacterium]|nr:hypothetical protein [Symbiobacteriaceae bacterium]